MKSLILVVALVLCASGAFAQAPHVANAAVQERAVAGSLESFFQALVHQQSKPAWIAYSVPISPGHRAGCWGNGDMYLTSGTVYLEGRPAGDRVVKLEGDATMLVLFRVEKEQVGRIAIFSPDCELDAGGLPFFVVTGVAPAVSVRLLAGYARGDATTQTPLARTAMTALGLQAEPAATETLIGMAKNDTSAGVRSQAITWLARRAGSKAAGAITDALANDPDAQVKERAVAALSQLPKDEGVPLLINVARSSRDARVRQRAMYYLGQSKDARAVAFFEEVLKAK